MRYALGLDFGTSGARAVAIDAGGNIQASQSVRFVAPDRPADWFEIWRAALGELLAGLGELRESLDAIAIDGTSSTVFLVDADGHPQGEPLLYNDDRARACLDRVAAIAPEQHPTRSATSSLAKFFWLLGAIAPLEEPDAPYFFCHQADWLAAQLHGILGVSDYNNALKLGYDPAAEAYPDWLRVGLARSLPAWEIRECGSAGAILIGPDKEIDRERDKPALVLSRKPEIILPRVLAPGETIAPVTSAVARRYGLPKTCRIVAGTTDSIASFLASGPSRPGAAVTALGSTLALKLLSRTRIDDARYGIYSHRLGDLWLAGGASNTGGVVLRQFFRDRELADLSAQLLSRPATSELNDLDYYPLPATGERFPINDPDLAPRLTPRPDDRAAFLHGLLDGMARIEAQGYRLLNELGADRLVSVETTGGGAQNRAWQRLRSHRLGVDVRAAQIADAAYGTARLALGGIPQV